MDSLPDWPDGTVAILATGGPGGAPHAIPVSTAVRAGERRILLALSLRRRSLALLRANPAVALSVVGAGDVAVTAHGTARVVQEPMAASDRVAAIAIEVAEVADHGQPRFVIEDGVSWRWTDDDAEATDAAIRAALHELGRELDDPATLPDADDPAAV